MPGPCTLREPVAEDSRQRISAEVLPRRPREIRFASARARSEGGHRFFERGEWMLRKDKEQVVAELAERLRSSDTLIVADYRGLTMSEIDGVRTKLLEHGARFTVVKNTLTKRAAEQAGLVELNEFLDGPTA